MLKGKAIANVIEKNIRMNGARSKNRRFPHGINSCEASNTGTRLRLEDSEVTSSVRESDPQYQSRSKARIDIQPPGVKDFLGGRVWNWAGNHYRLHV